MAPIRAQGADSPLSDILIAIQKKVALLKELNTDLIAEEEIKIEEFDNRRRVKKTTSIISEYRITPIKSKTRFSHGISQEERMVLSAKENGRTTKIRNFFEPLPIAGVNTNADLFVLFDKQNETHFDYEFSGEDLSVLLDKKNEKYINFKFNGIDDLKGRNIYIINIVQKERDIGRTLDNWRWDLRYRGVALIDAETMEVVQLNRERINTFRNRGFIRLRKYFFTQYEYERVKIEDQYFALPVAKIVEVYQMNGQLDTVYRYKYSNYKAFTVNSTIRFGDKDLSIDEFYLMKPDEAKPFDE